FKHTGAALMLPAVARFFYRDSGAPRQQFQRLAKIDALVLLNKADDIAVFTTGPAAVALPARIDIEGGARVVVEGAQGLEGGARGAQGEVAADDIDDVVGLLHPL